MRTRMGLMGAWLWMLLVVFASSPVAGQDASKVDLNQASLSELDELPGIGPAIAQRIIDYREENGPFTRIEDLMNVKGIGEKKFLRLKDLVSVEPAPQPKAPEQ